MGDWCMLPSDILGVIALKLDSIEEFIYFSVVCHSWNRASSMVKPEWSRANKPTPPWLLLAEPEPKLNNDTTQNNSSSNKKIFSISKNKFYKVMLPEITEKRYRCWGSCYGWIVILDISNNVRLYNPITKAELSLPSINQLLPSDKDRVAPHNNDNEYRLDEDDPFLCELPKIDSKEEIYMTKNYAGTLRFMVRKFIVLKIPVTNELVVFVIHRPYESLSFARPGDKSWTQVVDPWPQNPNDRVRRCIHHAMVWDGKVVILYSHINDMEDAKIAYCDIPPSTSTLTKVEAKEYITIPYNLCKGKNITKAGEMYMVELDGDLLIVVRIRVDSYGEEYPDFVIVGGDGSGIHTMNFEVYKHVGNTNTSTMSSSWEKVEDLGEFVLFVGDNSATALHISKAPNCQGNTIYFVDDDSKIHWRPTPPIKRFWRPMTRSKGLFRRRDMGMFNMSSKKVTSFYQDSDKLSKYFSPIWFMPNF